MIFEHTLSLVLSGQKTQTSRLIKAMEWYDANRQAVRYTSGIVKWQVGHTYPIQPAYGQKQVGRFLCQQLAGRDVRDFTQADAEREGFATLYDFWNVWTQMHDKQANQTLATSHILFKKCSSLPANPMDCYREYLKQRQAKLYQAWVIRFEVQS